MGVHIVGTARVMGVGVDTGVYIGVCQCIDVGSCVING